MLQPEISIHCKYDELVDPKTLKDHPKNRNKHSQDQIDRLAKLYTYHGVRHPIIVSKESGFIVAGHGRKAASLKAKLKRVPIVYQSFLSDDHEYAFIQADNAIAAWAELDLSGINADLPDLGPDFDIDLLGIKNFSLDFSEKLDETTQQIQDDMNKKYLIEVQFPNDMEMMDIHDDLVSRGYLVKIK